VPLSLCSAGKREMATKPQELHARPRAITSSESGCLTVGPSSATTIEADPEAYREAGPVTRLIMRRRCIFTIMESVNDAPNTSSIAESPR